MHRYIVFSIDLAMIYSLLHWECHFSNLETQSIVWISWSLLPRSVEKRPIRLGLENQIERHSKCNRLYFARSVVYRYEGPDVASVKPFYFHSRNHALYRCTVVIPRIIRATYRYIMYTYKVRLELYNFTLIFSFKCYFFYIKWWSPVW